jgi:hypothetical protein
MASPIGATAAIKTWRRPVENRPSIHCRPTSPNLRRRRMHRLATVDEAELGQLASLIARLSPAQQRLVAALADGFRGGWLEPFQWERAWRGSNLNDDVVLGEARTWLARHPRRLPDLLDTLADWGPLS